MSGPAGGIVIKEEHSKTPQERGVHWKNENLTQTFYFEKDPTERGKS
jgi:hypothetical protein